MSASVIDRLLVECEETLGAARWIVWRFTDATCLVVIASEAKQSIAQHTRIDGLLRRFAPRNDGRGQTARVDVGPSTTPSCSSTPRFRSSPPPYLTSAPLAPIRR